MRSAPPLTLVLLVICGFMPLALVVQDAVGAPMRPHGRAGVDRPATLSGRVVDAQSGAPIASALVRLEGHAGVLTNGRGQFTLRDVPPGEYRLEVQHLAYGTQGVPIVMRGQDVVDLVIGLGRQAVAIEGVDVRATRAPALQEFERRRQMALGGTFITGAELEQQENRTVMDALVRSGAVMLTGGGSGLRAGVTFRRHAASNSSCAPQIYIDGVRILSNPEEPAINVLHGIHVSTVAGIESYTSAATVPAAFGGVDAACGVIAVWTRGRR